MGFAAVQSCEPGHKVDELPGWPAAGFQGPSAYSCAWPAASLEGSWCSLLRESMEACVQNASVWGKEGESDAPYPEAVGKRPEWGSTVSRSECRWGGVEGGAPGPGDFGTSAGCSASAIWGSGRAGDGPTDWGLTLGCSLLPRLGRGPLNGPVLLGSCEHTVWENGGYNRPE